MLVEDLKREIGRFIIRRAQELGPNSGEKVVKEALQALAGEFKEISDILDYNSPAWQFWIDAGCKVEELSWQYAGV